jgi:hypothetical protein
MYRQAKRNQNVNSPRTKTNLQLKLQIVDEATRKSLLFHNVLLKEIKSKYANKKKTRQVLKKF